ncbi:DUF1285 domain-containing protein [Aestuariispira ectoiniformans]|uniref:DUF1285 domain-containing protein n=1 Tax=Aestuariispira ectoiniformans TaxID=2775080 RepID=UPI00223B74B3|nr:DUF1285 domain-containing protein [Aestuariispira ectoiniformans]
MTTQEQSRPNIKELMEKGEGLTGFPWPENYCDFDIRIGRDGQWYYHGSPIERLKLCKLFSTVLQKDDQGDYWLVTPGEKGRIDVEDAPFLAVELTVEGDGKDRILTFRTNLDHHVTVDADHPIRVENNPESGEPSPYVMVRDGLEAKINRSAFYELVELAELEEYGDQPVFGVYSSGEFFALGRID